MTATELRIGNYINYANSVKKLDAELFLKLLKYTSPFDPIPLTEEWLLKFGFKKVGINFELKSIVIWYSSYEKCFVWRFMNVGEDADRKVRLDYVHTLQNLYFALTNEELTIKSE